MLERQLEQYLIKKAREMSCLCYKWHSRTTRGVPDRIFILPNGIVYFIELKVKGGQLIRYQLLIKAELMEHNANYVCLTGKDEVDEFLEKMSCLLLLQ